MRYRLEVQSWADWEQECDFDHFNEAYQYALEKFSQNTWRVLDILTDVVSHTHDPMASVASQASAELDRMSRTDRWIARGRPQYAPRPPRPSHNIADVLKKQQKLEKVNWLVEGF